MKKTADLILTLALVLITATLFTQCNPDCDECTADKLEPFMKVKFINQDSLTKINTLRTQTNARVTTNNTLRTRYTDSINAGNNDYIFKRDSVGEILDSLQSHYTFLGKIKTTIEAGSVKLDTVYGYGMYNPIFFTNDKAGDTLTQFKFPLDPNSDSSRFIIKIRDKKYLLQVSYTKQEYQEINKIKIGLYNPVIDTSSFSKATIKCTFSKPQCLSNETQLVLSF